MCGRPSGTFTAEQIEVVRTGVRQRETTPHRAGLRGLVRVELDVVGGLAYAARNPAEPLAVMHVGEPVERGGSGEGASPLSHFLTGVAACLLNQFIRVAVSERYSLDFTHAAVRGELQRHSGGAFERIECRIHADGQISDSSAEALAERAERLCYVHMTLSRVVTMTTVLLIEDRERVRRVSTPPASAAAV